ncbi:MAG: hypothetical protein AVO35_11790 [Candidatus Aegiribacteria sp. MLS_C]|nr:MAG: hypothetical protein AVO35_11790 [Candidatus Aegiribacteria sp. MLS_C]
MPIRVWIEPERRLVRIEIEGDSTTEDILDSIDDAVSDPDAEPGFSILSDHRAVGEPLTTPQVQAMVSRMESLREVMSGCRWAVVTHKPASVGMMRMLAVLLNRIPMTIEVFGTMEEAEDWLFGGDRAAPAPDVVEEV